MPFRRLAPVTTASGRDPSSKIMAAPPLSSGRHVPSQSQPGPVFAPRPQLQGAQTEEERDLAAAIPSKPQALSVPPRNVDLPHPVEHAPRGGHFVDVVRERAMEADCPGTPTVMLEA